MSNTVKQPAINIPFFEGITAQQFRTHKLRLRTIFDTLELLKVFDGQTRYPYHRSRRRQKEYTDKSKQINQILTESFSKNATATSIISTYKLGRWRSYWKEINNYYDNKTELAGVNYQQKLINLTRCNAESIKSFVQRLEESIAECKAHKIPISESLLKSKLLENTTCDALKTMVMLRIDEGKSFAKIKTSVLNFSDSRKNNINANYSNSNHNKSVFKSHPILTKNTYSHKELNLPNNNLHNQDDSRIQCLNFKNYGHKADECRTNMEKHCTGCNNMDIHRNFVGKKSIIKYIILLRKHKIIKYQLNSNNF